MKTSFPVLLKKFQSQRSGAMTRRIGWELTFEQWLEWWGDDVDRRGRGPNDLQMQRINDAGPYALGNIVKGTPKQNAATANEQAGIRHAALVDSGYVWEPIKRPRISDAIAHVDIHGNAIELESEEESWIGPIEYGRAKPLGQII